MFSRTVTRPGRSRLARIAPAVLGLGALAVSAPGVHAQGMWDDFLDPTDGWFDMSGWLAKTGAFLPVPIVITEPAVGFGGGLAGVWFHDKPRGGDPWLEIPEGARLPPPTVSFGAWAGTENGSQLGAAGHIASWKEDTIRYQGILAKADLNLDFYVGADPFRFNFESLFLDQDVRFRLGESAFFLGAQYQYLDSDAAFDVSEIDPGGPPLRGEDSNAGAALVGYYDTRNNAISTTEGTEAQVRLTSFAEALGGDYDYVRTDARVRHFVPLADKARYWYGTRLEVEVVTKGAPFYARPSVRLRGVPALRYQGDQAYSWENQLGWRFHPRWSLVGFVGLGGANYEFETLPDSGLIVTGGTGFRYLMARPLGLIGGLDVAVGPEDVVVYLQFGTGL